ncbi:MAG: hypothetical protein JKY89_09945 [Immundisolibacteraceae bacterium]|nr:hypothetical protein [Immundisolibacteraceae bacterium]
MKFNNFAFIASGLGITLMLIALRGSQPLEDGSTTLPLLTLLIICEFAGIVTAIGAYSGVSRMRDQGMSVVLVTLTGLCGVLAVSFLLLGLKFWPL